MPPAIIAALIGAGAATTNAIGSGILQNQAAREERRAQEKLAREKADRISTAVAGGEATYDQIIDMLEDYKKGQTSLATPETYKVYSDLVSGFKPEDYQYDFEKFQYDKTLDDYMNPYIDEILQKAGSNVMHQYGKSGMGDSGFEQMAAFRSEAEKMEDLRKSAMGEYRADRDFAYKEYSDYITNMQNKYNNMADLTSKQINLMSGAIQHDEGQQSDYMADLIAAMTGKTNLGVQGAMYS